MSLDTTIGTTSAEAYCDIAFTDAYFVARGNSSWGLLTTANKEAYLRKATEYIDMTYCSTWKGLKTNINQALDWPRDGIIVEEVYVDPDTIPVPIKRACAEMALKASSEDIFLDSTRGVLEKQIGPIKTVYDPSSPKDKQYTIIEKLIAPYIRSMSGASVGLVRT